MADIADAKVLIIATDGVEQAELLQPRDALREAGAQVIVASPKGQAIQGMEHDEKGQTIAADLAIGDVDTEDYDALVLPGGVANPDKLRMSDDAIGIVQDFMDDGKTVAAICHGPWLLAEADVIDGRRLTSWPSIRTDLTNAGADVVDEEVVVDGNLITSRKPDDIPAFNRAIIEALTERVGEEA